MKTLNKTKRTILIIVSLLLLVEIVTYSYSRVVGEYEDHYGIIGRLFHPVNYDIGLEDYEYKLPEDSIPDLPDDLDNMDYVGDDVPLPDGLGYVNDSIPDVPDDDGDTNYVGDDVPLPDGLEYVNDQNQ